ncbi:MAG: transglutaminase-like domain-containing protein [Thermoplasmata archaeon]
MAGFQECSKIEFIEEDDSQVSSCNYFAYDPSFVENFRTFTKIEKLLKGITRDYEKAILITNWAHNQWKHNGINEPSVAEPIQILKEAKIGREFRCVEYSILLHAALNCYGLKSRVLYLRTHDVETRPYGAGHVVVECYLESIGKWALFDPQVNIHFEKNGIALNAVDLQHELRTSSGDVLMLDFNARLPKRLKTRYSKWICEYLYYFHTDEVAVFPPEYPRTQVVLMPLDAKAPTKFQGTPIREKLIPTNSYRAFYPDQKTFSWEYDKVDTAPL